MCPTLEITGKSKQTVKCTDCCNRDMNMFYDGSLREASTPVRKVIPK